MKRILFIELLGGIGDVLIALPAIKALALTHSQSRVTVLTFPPGGELIQSDPLIDVIYARRGEARQSVARILDQQDFDLIVSDTNYDGIADAINNSPTKLTVTNLWRNPPDAQLVSDRFEQILLEEGLITPNALLKGQGQPLIHLLEDEKAKSKQTFGARYRPLVFLIPDSGMSIKRWSKENWITVAKALQQQENATLIIPVGDDEDFAQQIIQTIGRTAQLWPRGTLRELAAGLAHADLAISVDTGSARIAAALNVPTITLFGPSWGGRYGQAAPHINLQGYPDCPERVIRNFTEQCCWYSGVCPFDWNSCTEQISPQQVLEAAAKFLKRQWRDKEIHPLSPVIDPPLPTALAQRQSLMGETPKTKTALAPRREPPRPECLPLERGELEKTSLLISEAREERKNEWQNVRNLLVMRLDNIGDVIITSPVLRAIKENLPQAKLTLMASPAGALTKPLLPWVDEVLPWRVLWQDLGRLNFDPVREWELIETLSQRQFDAAIILTSFSQSPHPAALACYLAGIPLRLGESKESGLGILTHSIAPAADKIHQVERNLRLIEAVGFKVRDRRLCLQISPVELIQNPYILLNPWTTCRSRNYNEQRFACAARHLSDLSGLPIVVTGTDKDRDCLRPLLDILGESAIDLVGATSLPEFAALVSKAQLVLTNNTSTMHIADATNTPSVILFSGTELESQWQPRYAPVKLLRRPTVCSPCYTFTCPYQLECLDIPPEEVVTAGLELLDLTAVFS